MVVVVGDGGIEEEGGFEDWCLMFGAERKREIGGCGSHWRMRN